MTGRFTGLIRRLAGNSSGVTLVEFALVAPVLLLLVVGGFEVAHMSYVRGVLQSALTDAARRAAVEDPTFGDEDEPIEDRVEALLIDKLAGSAPNGRIEVSQQSYFDFTDIGNPEKLMTDVEGNGQYDEADGDCFADLNENGEYDTDTGRDGIGGANDVVLYEAELRVPRLFPLHAFMDVDPDYVLRAETAVRNQPYAVQATPPVVCGDAS